jgi:hypothetical protein
MTTKQTAEVAARSVQAVEDVVKAQVAKGAKTGMTGARQTEVIAVALNEVFTASPMPGDYGDEDKWQRNVIRAFFGATSAGNASQLRQELEKKGILDKTGGVNYGGIES